MRRHRKRTSREERLHRLENVSIITKQCDNGTFVKATPIVNKPEPLTAQLLERLRNQHPLYKKNPYRGP